MCRTCKLADLSDWRTRLKVGRLFQNLEIQEGQLAGLEYLRMIDPSISTDEKEKIKKDLLTYCGYDTLAMLKIREELLKKFN